MNDIDSLKESLALRTQERLERSSRKRLVLVKDSIAIDLQKTKDLVESWKTETHVTAADLEYMKVYIEATEKWLRMIEEQLERVKERPCEGCDAGHPGQLAHYGGCLPDPFCSND
jgi:hypothetical protein